MQNNNTLLKRLMRYLAPSVASLTGLSLYILADTYFISVGVGSAGLAALNIVLPAYSMVNAVGLMIGIGTGVNYTIHRSTGDDSAATKIFNLAIRLAMIAGIIFTVIGTAFTPSIARLLGASESILPLSVEYLRTIMCFSLFFLLNNTLTALVRNDCNPRLAMTAMMTNSLSNIILDALFILVFDWGMWGAAFATGLSPILGLCILSVHWIKGNSGLHLRRGVPDFSLTARILRSGSANGIIELGNGVVIFLFNIILMRLSGDIGVAAYGIVANISLVISYIFIGIGQGIQPVISQSFGEGNHEECRHALRLALRISVGVGILFFTVGQLFPVTLASAFNREGNQQLLDLTVQAIRIYFSCFLFMGIGICFASYYQSILRSRSAMIISLLRSFILVVAGAALLPQLLGVTGVWMIMPLCELITMLYCISVPLLRKLRCHSQPVKES